MKIYKCAEEAIGNTPLFELLNLKKELSFKGNIFAKAEFFNPAGSIKDRAAQNMLNEAEEQGLIKKGSVIIEPTSGNTGIGLALCAIARGYKCKILMPGNMSKERIKLMEAYGAEVILTDATKGMAGAIEEAEKLAKEIPGSFIPDQFGNNANANAHYKTTGPEIYCDLDGKIDILVSAVGTGGTITGTGRYLKEQNPNIKIVAVEPQTSAVLSGKEKGPHAIQGIGAGFIPEVLDTNIYDEVIAVSDDDAFKYAKLLGKTEGLLCGISSGAALKAGIELAKRDENKDKNIVVILPDTASRYMSTELF